jgi:hypothetical protein
MDASSKDATNVQEFRRARAAGSGLVSPEPDPSWPSRYRVHPASRVPGACGLDLTGCVVGLEVGLVVVVF